MDELGKLDNPEQYYPIDNSFVFGDSLAAFNFFDKKYPKDDIVTCLVNARLNSAVSPYLLLWACVLVKEQQVIDYVSVFEIKNPEVLTDAIVLEFNLVSEECYFYWNRNLYASVLTNNRHIAIRQIRSILSSYDMSDILKLRETDCYHIDAVKVFMRNNGKFVGVFWKCFFDNEVTGFECVCGDDVPEEWNTQVLYDTFHVLIDIGECVIIDGAYHILKFDAKAGKYFERLPDLVSDEDKLKEDIPIECFRGRLFPVSYPPDDEKKEKTKSKKARIIAFKH